MALFASAPVHAQERAPVEGPATRSALEALAAEHERRADDSKLSSKTRDELRRDAAAIRDRLRVGDFAVGDQIALLVTGDAALSDTFTVREGPALVLPNIPEITLRGILRAELQQHLTTQLAQYLRSTAISATPLVRIAVLGEVRNPGFYRVSAHLPLSDALMAAGGPTAAADLSKTLVRRSGQELYDSKRLAQSFSAGSTIDQLGLRAGDEIVIAARRTRNWTMLTQTAALIVGLAVSISALRR